MAVPSLVTHAGHGAAGVQASSEAHRLGTASIAIPVPRDPAGSWHATIVVTGVSAPAWSPDGVCH